MGLFCLFSFEFEQLPAGDYYVTVTAVGYTKASGKPVKLAAALSQSHSDFNFRNNNHTLKAGFDYYADKKNIFGVVLNGFGFFGRPMPMSTQAIIQPGGAVQSVLVSTTTNTLNNFNYSANVNYKHSFVWKINPS
jgi:hypothetical protein